MRELDDKKTEILKEYDKKHKVYESFAKQVENLLMILIQNDNIKISSIQSRVKEKQSLEKKIEKKQTVLSSEDKRSYKYNKLEDITDICGIRICTFYSDDVDKIADIIEREFLVDQGNSIDKRKAIEPDRFGYLSLHYIVSLSEERQCLSEYTSFSDCKFEIQIRSILQHTWAEIEHDLGYKSSVGIPKEIRRDFSRLSSLLELADKEFLSIRNKLDSYQEAVKGSLITGQDQNINIDRISIKKLMDSDFFTQHVDYLEKKLGLKTKYYSTSADIDDIVDALNYLDINTIDQLKYLLNKSKEMMILSLIDSDSIADRGIFFYCCYYLVIKNELGLEVLQEVYSRLGIGDRATKKRYAEFQKFYKKAATKTK
ncbi:GTP pyrophosphokinase [Enterococcus wangshanyuanii]|uniref:RelA/SpoT domain-containing protein n=1 Tax=Enterococcus wangshanyuanii TaxID=2005703 RepID=A0ABQ1PA23_9ENTE|nr:hypothetical protein [Enterococcus wangshanyuanii]GGC93757.1 hypothetical protein GCM10011573_24240 [Enterococcus wangshanyuanii]